MSIESSIFNTKDYNAIFLLKGSVMTKKRGVYFHKYANKWTAQIKVGDKTKHLGLFEKHEDAVRARLDAESIYSYKEIGFFKESITQNELKDVLHYNAETGVFTWKINYGGHVVKDREAGGTQHDIRVGGKSYIVINIYKRKYSAHRLAFLYMTGKFPTEVTDHINGDGTDNRWCNLREASIAENNRNARLQHNNKSGAIGVSWHKQHQKWNAQITHNGKTIFLGIFVNFDEACAARAAAEIRLGFHKNHGQIRPL